jgi:hypothetical protein
MNEQQERVAQAIYLKMPGSEAHPWVEGGNSLKQDEARAYARAALAAQGVPADSEIDALWEKAATVGIGNMATYLQAREFAKLLLASAPPQAQQAAPLTNERLNELRAVYMHDKSSPFARMVEAACAEAWGVKLAGIGASSGSAS